MYATWALPVNGIRWCSHSEYKGMSRTMIISSWSAPSTTVTSSAASCPTPAKISRYMRATLAVERLLLDQSIGECVQLLAALGEDLERDVVRLVDQLTHLCVDLERDGIGVIGRRAPVAAEEHLSLLHTERPGPDRVGHAVLRDHLSRHLRRPLDVVDRSRRDVARDDLLGDATTHQ